MARKGPKKPAREMTTQEAAERLFGKRVITRVQQELEKLEHPVKPDKSVRVPSIKDKDR